jgi:hypothetical protein
MNLIYRGILQVLTEFTRQMYSGTALFCCMNTLFYIACLRGTSSPLILSFIILHWLSVVILSYVYYVIPVR